MPFISHFNPPFPSMLSVRLVPEFCSLLCWLVKCGCLCWWTHCVPCWCMCSCLVHTSTVLFVVCVCVCGTLYECVLWVLYFSVLVTLVCLFLSSKPPVSSHSCSEDRENTHYRTFENVSDFSTETTVFIHRTIDVEFSLTATRQWLTTVGLHITHIRCSGLCT